MVVLRLLNIEIRKVDKFREEVRDIWRLRYELDVKDVYGKCGDFIW